MKITFLLTSIDDIGGTERAILTQAEGLADRHQLEVISLLRKKATTPATVPRSVRVRYLIDATGAVPKPLREHGLSDAQCSRLAAAPSHLVKPEWEQALNRLTDIELEAALAVLDSDVLVTANPALMAVATAYTPARVALVHQEHRVSELRGPTGVPLHQSAHRVDGLVALSETTADWFAALFGAAAPKIAVIGNAIPGGYRPRSTRRTKTVTIAGRLVTEKQVHHAIQAFGKVASQFPDWTLRVCGAGPELSRLKQAVSEASLHDRVQLVGSVADMAEEWAKASIGLLTSRVESFGLVIVEAMAAGVPVVSYDCPNGPRRIIADGVDGLLVPLDDIDALAQSLIKLIADEELLDRLGTAAQANCARFDLAHTTAQWEEFYGSLVAQSAAQRVQSRAERVAIRATSTGGGTVPVADERTLAAGPIMHDRRAQEVRIGLLHGNAVRFHGQLHLVDDDATPNQVFDMNLDLVTRALAPRSIPYFVIRDSTQRHHIGVKAEHRAAVLAALAETHRDAPVYVATLTTKDRGIDTTLAALTADLRQVDTCAAIRVFQPVVTSEQTVRYTGVYGCTVSFWADEAAEERPPGMSAEPVLISGMPTIAGTRIPASAFEPATVTVRERPLPSVSAFDRSFVYDVEFPVDVVYTWVDGSDPTWLAARAAAGKPVDDAAAHNARFRDREELRYSLRSVEQYLPWVRTIFLVTAGQSPSWLDTGNPRIRVVDHREIFRDASVLPTFNSHAIESQLHHIDGLAEHFLYFNDDVFAGRLLGPDAFFHSNGMSKYFQSPTAIPLSEAQPDDEFNITAAKNNRKLIEQTFGRTLTHAFLHTPHPLRRSVLAEIEEKFADEVATTAAARFRSAQDLAIVSSLHHYYGYLSGKTMPGAIRSGFVNVGLRDQHQKLIQLLAVRGHDVFCINDYHGGDVSDEEQSLAIAAFLQAYFPVPSSFEKD